MIDARFPSPGEEILDLAAGTGIAGFAAAEVVGPEGKGCSRNRNATLLHQQVSEQLVYVRGRTEPGKGR